MTQCDQIFDHLKRYGTITPLVALDNYQCFRLAARVKELKDAGHDIQTEMTSNPGSKKRFARYRYHSERP